MSAKTIPITIPTKSVNNPVFKACFHLVTFTVPKYKARIYIVVSVDPWIVDAIFAVKESGPSVLQIVSKQAIEADPDIGRNKIIGVKSIIASDLGINDVNNNFKSSIIPHDFNNVTHKSIPIIVGNNSLNKGSPSFTPLTNEL